jgi:cellulose synthase/poly-beta-1,6-N-acetylglucosamine synthase-like glycosyltransferase
MAAEFEADPETAVVGAHTAPRGGISVERCYWTAQNRVRLLESRIGHVSMVMACCYAFRRSLLKTFPEDVVADDVYIAALANTLGYHTKYSARAVVEELRVPQTLPDFFRHKFRKGNAVLREYLRFCYRLPDLETRWKSILGTRIVQQLLLPWGTALWLTLAVTLLNLRQIDVPCMGAAVLLVGLLATRKATMSVTPPGGAERFGAVTLTLAYVYTMAVLCANALTYASFRQSSCYSRLGRTIRRSEHPWAEIVRPPWSEAPSSLPAVPTGCAALGAIE